LINPDRRFPGQHHHRPDQSGRDGGGGGADGKRPHLLPLHQLQRLAGGQL
jgi:hypothetical protein